MGRPIKSTWIGNAAGRIEVTGAFSTETTQPDGSGAEALVTTTGSYISSQRSASRFKVVFTSTDGSTTLTQVLDLKAVAPGSLSATPPNGAAGEFCVQVILSDSTVAYVERFYNNTIHYVTAAGAAGTCTYTLGVEGTDEQATAGTGTIDVITLQ